MTLLPPNVYGSQSGAPPVQKSWIVPRAALEFEYERPVFVPPPRRRRTPRRQTNKPNWGAVSSVIGGILGVFVAQILLWNLPESWKFNRDPTGLVRVLQHKIDDQGVKR